VLRALRKLVRCVFAERRVTQVSDEYVAGDEMVKARAVGPKAEVDLHAVIAAEQRCVERSDRGNALVPEIEARSVDDRQRDALTAIRMHEQCVERRRRVTVGKRMVVPAWQMDRRADGVGERADDADPLRTRVLRQSIEPITGHLGVGMENDLVAIAVQRERTIHRSGETLRSRLRDERRATAFSKIADIVDDWRLGARIVDDDELVGHPDGGRQHAFDAPARRIEPAEYGNDHVDRGCHSRTASLRRATPSGQRSQPGSVSRYASRARVSSSAAASRWNAAWVRTSSASTRS